MRKLCEISCDFPELIAVGGDLVVVPDGCQDEIVDEPPFDLDPPVFP